MTQYRVFLGAPSRAEMRRSSGSYQWQTVSSEPLPSASVIFPPATLEAASRRISLIYQGVIFKEPDEGDGVGEKMDLHGSDQTTAITWPPTAAENTTDSLPAQSKRAQIISSASASGRQLSLYATQETQETASLHSLTSLSTFSALSKSRKGSSNAAILVAALEVEGPDSITVKKGADAGKQISLLKMILGDEYGNVCKLTAWRDIADEWGGNVTSPGVKRGDICLIENVTVSWEPTTSISITASSYLKSRLNICYRTMPYTHEDKRLRPDLRLGFSDPAVRKVAVVVEWFERMAGLAR
ncbi:hypothetical protein PILCRDRAFT_617244 [Piloderma croceum F 1598]|uniref:Shieldin complex subunit 2 first OB fold domain-containing protein n=1 Tax=Piloderma croceum (strain F 1598) TaxID=765440 RepID=A0A0C3FCJ7_PILCF|nr:hypothetical protein PILCRDRAFT_617244 [Piloderma croceum F 1598]